MSENARRRSSFVKQEGNPLARGSTNQTIKGSRGVAPSPSTTTQDQGIKIENLAGASLIHDDQLEALIKGTQAQEANKDKLSYLEQRKTPYLFTTSHLLRLLQVTESVKTRISIIQTIGPRLTDPRNKNEILDLFRFSEEKRQVEDVLKTREQVISKSQFVPAARGGGIAGRGRGGTATASRGRGRGTGSAQREASILNTLTSANCDIDAPLASADDLDMCESSPGPSNGPQKSVIAYTIAEELEQDSPPISEAKESEEPVLVNTVLTPESQSDNMAELQVVSESESQSDTTQLSDLQMSQLLGLDTQDESTNAMEVWEEKLARSIRDSIVSQTDSRRIDLDVEVETISEPDVDVDLVQTESGSQGRARSNSGCSSLGPDMSVEHARRLDIEERKNTHARSSPNNSEVHPTMASSGTLANLRARAGSVHALKEKFSGVKPVLPMTSGSSKPSTEEIERNHLYMNMIPEQSLGIHPNGVPIYSYTELVRRNELKIYHDILQTQLEDYLSDNEFLLRFNMSRAEFSALPKWRRNERKKALRLF